MSVIKKILAKGGYKLYSVTAPSLDENYQAFGRRMFFAKEMCKTFPWKTYARTYSPYFKKWGFDVPMVDAEYYGRISGVKADHYVTRSMAMHYIYPYLCRYEFLPAYMDKNFQKKAIDLKSAQEFVDVQGTKDIVYNSNGIYYDSEDRVISFDDALSSLVSYGKPMIVKPTLETYGGKGVQMINAGASEDELKGIIRDFHYDFTFQEVVEQHPVLAAFNKSSVNTIRMVTYRNPKKETKVLYSCLRFGGEGEVIDNVCSGGGYTGVDVSGKLKDSKKYGYFTMDATPLPESFPKEIPYWDKVVDAALFLHSRLPHFDIIGWDFSITPDGHPVLIEYNLRPGVGLQQAVGPMFSVEDLDEIMEHVSKYKLERETLGVLKFKDLPGRTTVHYKFRK